MKPVRQSHVSPSHHTHHDSVAVSEIMAHNFLAVPAETSLESLMLALLDRGAGGATVVDAEGRLIGFVSMTDIVREWNAVGDTEDDLTVGQVMVRPVITLPEHATLSRAASIMAFEGVHQIPVVSAEGSVIGIVNALDIMRHLAQDDGFLVPLRSRNGGSA